MEKKVAADQAFAQRMVHDHTQTTEQLKHLVNGGKVKVQLPRPIGRRSQTNARKATRGKSVAARKDYNQMQLTGHKEAVALFEAYAKSGDNEALKSWAAKTLPHLQEHLAMAEKLSQR